MLSPDGRCKAFDASGNGYPKYFIFYCIIHLNVFDRLGKYVRSEGFCVLVVKPLSKALADGDPIRAIVKATGTNQVKKDK